MKKYLITFLIVLFISPIIANASSNSAIIEINKTLENGIINDYHFKFILKDINGNILQTKENNGEKITFDPIEYKEEEIGKTFYYIISEENDDQLGISYDKSLIYVGVKVKEENSEIFYTNPSQYTKKEPNPFHASPDELTKEAYAVYDINTKTLTFFRDEANKYTNEQVIDNYVYFANFENGNNANWIYNNHSYHKIEKITFRDAVKPKSIAGWFKNMPTLKEMDIKKLDTSLITNLNEFLYDCPDLREIDISTMDVSNVTNFAMAFKYSGIEKLDFTVWDLDHLKGTMPLQEFVNSMPNLRYLDISNFEAIDSSAEFANLPCLEYVHLGNKFKFYRALLDRGDTYFLKINNNTLYRSTDLTIPYNVDIGNIEGYYVRPSCTTKASFTNKYTKIDNNIIKKEYKLTTTSKLNINELFPDIKENINWEVQDPTILKIESNQIIPLKAGKTMIEATEKNNTYQLDIIIENEIIENPQTGNNYILLIVILLFSFIIIITYGIQKAKTSNIV